MDSNRTLWPVSRNPLWTEAFGLEEPSAVRREAVWARANAEASTHGERGRLQVVALA